MGTENTTSTQMILHNMLIVSAVIYSLISVIGVLGNGLVIYVAAFKMKKTVNSMWFLNLALADFLFTACLVFSIVSLSQEHNWPFGRVMCKLTNLVSTVNMFASVFFLTAISIDRCLCILMVVWAQNKRTLCKAQIISAVIWVIAIICSTPFAVFRDVQERPDAKRCNFKVSKDQMLSLYIFRFVVGFGIPFLVILVCNIAIGVRAKRLQRTRTTKSLRMIIYVIVAFFICWLPFHVLTFMNLTHKDLKNFLYIGSPLAVSLAFANSCLNPILYVFLCHEFQKKLRKSICFVLESALAEDQLSFASSRSMSSYFSRFSQKPCKVEAQDATNSSLSIPEDKQVFEKVDTEKEIAI